MSLKRISHFNRLNPGPVFHTTANKFLRSSVIQLNIDISQWKCPPGIKLADKFHRPATIDLLIGAETFFEVLQDGKVSEYMIASLSEHSFT